MPKIFGGLAVVLLAVFGWWYIGHRSNSGEKKVSLAGDATMTTVRITTMPVVQGLPFYLAKEKGYFREAGIDAEFVKFETPNQIIDALLQGRVDITPPSAATGVVGIADSKNSGKLLIYSMGGGDDVVQNDALLVRADSSLVSFQDLQGKKVGIVAGSVQWNAIARDILARHGLLADENITLVELPLGLQSQALAAGQVDALITVEPIPTVVKAKGIGKEMIDHLTTRFISNPFYSGVGVIRKDFVGEHPEVAKKVLDVFDRAIAEINDNPDAARQYLKGYTALDDDMIKIVPISRFRMYNNLDENDIDATQTFFDIFTTQDIVKEPLYFRKLLYDPSVL